MTAAPRPITKPLHSRYGASDRRSAVACLPGPASTAPNARTAPRATTAQSAPFSGLSTIRHTALAASRACGSAATRSRTMPRSAPTVRRRSPAAHDETDARVPERLAPTVAGQPESEGVETEGDERQELGDRIEPPHRVLHALQLVRAQHLDRCPRRRNPRGEALAQPDPASSTPRGSGANRAGRRLPRWRRRPRLPPRRAHELRVRLAGWRAPRGPRAPTCAAPGRPPGRRPGEALPRRDRRNGRVVREHVLELGLDVDAAIDLVDRVVRDSGANRRIVQQRGARAYVDIRVEHLTLDPHRENRQQRDDGRRDHETQHNGPTQTTRSSDHLAGGRHRISLLTTEQP